MFALYLKIVGGVAVLGAAYFGWKRLEVNQEGQITERFTRAIDQLGSEKLEVRLGGIYALERIAKDSEKDTTTVLEVLCSYLREHTAGIQSIPADIDYSDPVFVHIQLFNKLHMQLSADQKACLSIVGRVCSPEGFSKYLKGACIGGTEQVNSSFTNSSFEKSFLCAARFDESNFYNSWFVSAVAVGMDFSSSDCSNISIIRSDFRYCRALKTNFTNAYLIESDFSGAFLEETYLYGTGFKRSRLLGTRMERALGLTKHQIESAIIDRETKLPDYLMDDPEWYEEQIKRSEEWLAENQDKDNKEA